MSQSDREAVLEPGGAKSNFLVTVQTPVVKERQRDQLLYNWFSCHKRHNTVVDV